MTGPVHKETNARITAGAYDQDDYDRLVQIQREFEEIRAQEARRARIRFDAPIRTAVHRVGTTPAAE